MSFSVEYGRWIGKVMTSNNTFITLMYGPSNRMQKKDDNILSSCYKQKQFINMNNRRVRCYDFYEIYESILFWGEMLIHEHFSKNYPLSFVTTYNN